MAGNTPGCLQQSISSHDAWHVLAGLRFVLATCVLITHAGIVAPDSLLFSVLGYTGYPAVFAFFIISGYSIAASIGARKAGFVMRRVRRIFPALILTLALCLLLACFKPLVLPGGQTIQAANISSAFGNLFMLQGLLCDTMPVDGVLWSLSIEWWLYMLAPILIRLDNRVTTLLGLASFISMCLYYNVHGYVQMLPQGMNLPLLSWAWLFGFAYYRNKTPTAFLLLITPPLILFDVYIHLKFSTVVIAVTAVALSASSGFGSLDQRLRDILNWLGDASYPLYLMQAPLLWMLVSYTPMRNGHYIILAVILLVLLGYKIACWFSALLAAQISPVLFKANKADLVAKKP